MAFVVSAAAILFLAVAGGAFAAEAIKKPFDLSIGVAEQSLKKFSLQSGREVLFATDTAASVKTNRVRGEYTPQEAVDLLLAGTGLVAKPNAKTGAFTIARHTDANTAGPGAPPRDSKKKSKPRQPSPQYR